MKTPHVHAAMIKEWAEDTSRVVEYFDDRVVFNWLKDGAPYWWPNVKYRFRHKHQDLIDQKAARPELIVEWRSSPSAVWNRLSTIEQTKQYPNEEYRLVEPPKQKKTVKMWQWVIRHRRTNRVFLWDAFFQNELEARGNWDSAYDIIQRADWTEIEILEDV